MRPQSRYAIRTVLLVIAGAMLVASCSSTSDADAATEQQKAESLVQATQAAGVAPRLTVDIAESLYGTSAPAVCDVFDGGLSTSESLILLGNPANGRRKTITTNAVTYAQLVVETYCPDELGDFNDAVAGLDPFESGNS